jgi:hypothetical protein
MNAYTTHGCKSTLAESMQEAAEIFASRKARRKYGRNGYARTCQRESSTMDGEMAEYNAFLGYTLAGKHNTGTTVGGNERFSVRILFPKP